MADLRTKLNTLYSLEQLAGGQTYFHRLHPLSKLLVTAVFLICVVSFNRYALGRLLPYFFYPVLVMALARMEPQLIWGRAAVALPFCLFAGLSNVLFDRTVLFYLGFLPVTSGLVSLLVIVLRTLLCVSGVLLLVALTPFVALTDELRRLHLPALLVTLLEMVYRYIGVLVEEALNMLTAFRLRSGGARWPGPRDLGAFLGQLLLRSTDRAERVYHAMQCRLYGQRDRWVHKKGRPFTGADWWFMILAGGGCLLFRLVDVPALIGSLFTR